MNIFDFIDNTLKNGNLCSKQLCLRILKYKIFHTEVCYYNTNRSETWNISACIICAPSHMFKNCTTKELSHRLGK